MTNYLRELLFGISPIHRTNPQPGQTEWYYKDPRYSGKDGEISVASENTPNPEATAIQNYLYTTDKYNYEQLYGANPPPTQEVFPTTPIITPTLDNSIENSITTPTLPNKFPYLYPKEFTFDDIYYSRYDENGNQLYKGITDVEGGYSNRKTDSPTNYGVRQAALNEYNTWNDKRRTMFNLPNNVEQLQHDQAKNILNEMYYQRYAINKINQFPIAANVTDQVINGGPVGNYLLADTINEHTAKSYPRNMVISDSLADRVNNLAENEIIPVNDSYTRNRMKRYFNVVNKNPSKINSLKGWYDRAKKFYSSPEEFDNLYKAQKEEYFNKYKQYYNKK